MNFFISRYHQYKQTQHITTLDITLFLRQLATLIIAGVPLIQSCDLLEKSQVKIAVRLLIYSIKREMLNGKAFFYSLRCHRHYFDELTCQLVNIAEHTGKLEIMLGIIADQQEKNLALKKKIKQALFYPCMMTLTALIITISMLIFVIPRFAELFHDTQITLPLLTIVIFYLSQQLQQHILLFAIVFVLTGLLCLYSPMSIRFKQKMTQWMNQTPPLRYLLHKILLARFARNLAVTFAAGIPIHEALTLASHGSGNAEFDQTVLKMRQHLNAGHPLYHAMESLHYFPDLVIQMIKIGEESGMLVLMLNKLADFFEADIEQLIIQLHQLLEPLIMLVLGVLIGGLVIGMYLPIFKLGSAL